MKILFVTARLPAPPNDGGAAYLYNLIKGLSDLGHQVHIASFLSNLHEQDESEVKKFASLYTKDAEFKQYGFKAALKAVLTRQPVHIQHRMNKNIFAKILSQIKEDIDIILLGGLHTSNFVQLLRKKFPEKPIILQQVNIEHKLLIQNARNTNNPLLKLFLKDQSTLLRKFEIEAISEADGLTSISDEDLKVFEDIANLPKSVVIPPGANILKNVNFENREYNHILAFGSWDWAPNHDGLVWFLKHIWSEIKELHPNLKMSIAGAGLSEKVKNNLPSGITYLGFIDDLTYLKKTCTLQVIPLISGSGVKLKVIEAISAGIPIVSTKFGVEGTLLKNNEHFLLAKNATDFVEKTSELLNTHKKREVISNNAYALAKKYYSWEMQAKKLHEFISSDYYSGNLNS